MELDLIITAMAVSGFVLGWLANEIYEFYKHSKRRW